jgi:hypothetical protein
MMRNAIGGPEGLPSQLTQSIENVNQQDHWNRELSNNTSSADCFWRLLPIRIIAGRLLRLLLRG